MNLADIQKRFFSQIAAVRAGDDLADYDDLYEALFEHYTLSGEMPYGVAKARTGDPYQWLTDKIVSFTDVKTGDRVRSYDFPGLSVADYIEGTVEDIRVFAEFGNDCLRTKIKVEKIVRDGEDVGFDRPGSYVYPPSTGVWTLTGKVVNGTVKLED